MIPIDVAKKVLLKALQNGVLRIDAARFSCLRREQVAADKIAHRALNRVAVGNGGQRVCRSCLPQQNGTSRHDAALVAAESFINLLQQILFNVVCFRQPLEQGGWLVRMFEGVNGKRQKLDVARREPL